jgi:hypothetical protein
MGKRVFKYNLPYGTGSILTDMPAGARILHVGIPPGSNKPQVWALVDPDKPMLPSQLVFFDTGQPLPEAIDEYRYVGTFYDVPFVWHVFETPT